MCDASFLKRYGHNFLKNCFAPQMPKMLEIAFYSELYSSSKLNGSSQFNSVFSANSVANSSGVHLRKTELEQQLNLPLNFYELSSKTILRESGVPLVEKRKNSAFSLT